MSDDPRGWQWRAETLGGQGHDQRRTASEISGASCRRQRPKVRYRQPGDRRSRAQRWRDVADELVNLQEDYRAWLDSLPATQAESATAEALQAIGATAFADLAVSYNVTVFFIFFQKLYLNTNINIVSIDITISIHPHLLVPLCRLSLNNHLRVLLQFSP